MQMRALGQSGIQASAVGFGAWAVGGWMWGGADESDAIAAIHAAIDAGVNLIDTAPIYGFGVSEEIVGKAIADRREKVVLATKCGIIWDNPDVGEHHFYSDGIGKTEQPGRIEARRYCGGDSLKSELEQSLKRLRTDCIDLYQTHWQDPTTAIEERMGVLLEMKQQGKIRAIGVSNATCAHMDEYREFGPIDADQERFSMIDRRLEAELLPYCRGNEIAMLAYCPLEQGLLTGKITPDRRFGPGDQRLTKPAFAPENLKRVDAMLARFRPIAEAHGLTLAQLAIAWTIAQPGVTHALCGARNPQQATENAAAGVVTLTQEEHEVIDAAIADYLASSGA